MVFSKGRNERMPEQRLHTLLAHSDAPSAEEAVRELAAKLTQPSLAGVIVFASSSYDLDVLGPALRAAFPCAVVGCTSSGQLGPWGFRKGGITAVSLAGNALTMTPFLVAPLHDCYADAERVASEVRAIQALRPGRRAFGLVLVDGLSLAEEQLTASLYHALGNVPIVGGSAGDDLAFEETKILHAGRFISGAASFVLFDTALPFETFRFQHFVPTDARMVITEADASRRVVNEINGLPAAEAYAELIGVPIGELDAHVFARHPVMLRLGDEYYVRSIAKVNDDLSMSFLCAIEEGLVLTLGRGIDAIETAKRAFDDIGTRLGQPSVVIGCDCILRRLELEHEGLDTAVGEIYAKNRVFGFSTYGEQFGAVHVNQTFAGVAIRG
jgi:hypothetical protein